jgi:hypothetical protein
MKVQPLVSEVRLLALLLYSFEGDDCEAARLAEVGR